MSEAEKKILLAVKIIFVSIPFFIFFWIANQNYAFTGLVKYVYHPDKYLASQIVTLDQANLIQGVFQSDGKIHWQAADDSLKFTAKILRNFDKVKVRIDLNNISQTDIYLHAQGGVEKGEYHDLVSSQFLDQLTWSRLATGNLTLWQRPEESLDEQSKERVIKQYASVDEFLANLPSADKIGVFGLPAGQFSQFSNYLNNQEEREIKHYFRGQHSLHFYKGDEPFNFSFKKIDLNRVIGPHVLNFKVYSGSELVFSRSVPAGQTQEVNINLPDLKRGYYRLFMETNEDVIFGDIKTNIKYLFFSGHVFLADGTDYIADNLFKELVLFTDSASLTFDTPHDSAINQNITVSRNQSVIKTISIKEKKQVYAADKLTGGNNITIPKASMLITGGNFSFPGFQLVNGLVMPAEGKLAEGRIEDLDYIVASYAPKESQGLISYEKEYAFKDLFQKDKKIYFNVYSPGLYANKAQLEIKQIEVTFIGQALTPAKIWEKVKLFINNTFK